MNRTVPLASASDGNTSRQAHRSSSFASQKRTHLERTYCRTCVGSVVLESSEGKAPCSQVLLAIVTIQTFTRRTVHLVASFLLEESPVAFWIRAFTHGDLCHCRCCARMSIGILLLIFGFFARFALRDNP